jgi:signal peptidase I
MPEDVQSQELAGQPEPRPEPESAASQPPPPSPPSLPALPSGVRPRRHAWLAALLSLLSCGLGQVYCGRMRRGLGFVAAGTGLVVLVVAVLSLLPASNAVPFILLVLVPVAFAVEIWMIADACILARRVRGTFEPKRYNRFAIYLLWALGVLGINSVSSELLRTFCIEIYRIPTRSGCPTIMPGDRVLAIKAAYLRRPVRRGDTVVYVRRDAWGQEANWIKRVVALDGDTVEMRGDDLYVNGLKLPREAVPDDTLKRAGVRAEHEIFRETNGGVHYRIMLLKPGPVAEGAWPGFDSPVHMSPSGMPRQFAQEGSPTVVPRDHCFVIGDNRLLSSDSRDFGPLPLWNVRGRIDYVIWPAGGGWSRFGVLRD